MNARLLFASALFAAAAGLAVGSGCTSSDPGTGPPSSCAEYAPPAAFDAQNPKISFKNDLAPMFEASCGFTSCHGAATGANNGLYVGKDGARFVKEAVGQPALQLTSMPFVTAGDPKKSYFMHKLDNDLCVFDKQCGGGSCLDPMPQSAPLWSVEDRDKVRRWIAQGAQNN